MVQINLPQNSKVEKGKYFKDKTGSKNIRKVNIYRWDPSTGDNPRIDTYEVDMDNCPSKVLDLLNKIKNEIDPSIAYRRSCAHGVCGSCAMNMDGKNGLACTKPHICLRPAPTPPAWHSSPRTRPWRMPRPERSSAFLRQKDSTCSVGVRCRSTNRSSERRR